MYNLYINEKRKKETEDKIKGEEKNKLIAEKRESKLINPYIIFISK